ncbi:MAG TPA: LLM class flavin-dependent oxidoreductase [Patescibacteria group bacterium]|nr:LLM class flavin-dependent oxidoreductase [Patescibacteria group bacterium]
MRLGLNLPYTEGQMAGATPRWSDIRAMAGAAEAIGFDAIWVSDHVGFGDPVAAEPGAWSGAWEAWTLVSALAEATTRVELGTYVLCSPFRNPALLAKMAETLDEISDGRVILGLGAGWNEVEFRSYGYPFAERFDRFEDGLRIIAELLRTGRATHAGRRERARDARLEPRGPRPAGLPIMVGAGGPRMLRLTAELADRWNGGLTSRADLRASIADVDAACAAVGRDPASLGRSAEVLVRTLPAGATEVPETAEIHGSPADIAAELSRYVELGIDELQVQLRPNTLAGLDAFTPILREVRNRTAA